MKNNKNTTLFNTPSPALRASSPSRGEGNDLCSLPPWRGKVGKARMRGNYVPRQISPSAAWKSTWLSFVRMWPTTASALV